VIALFRNFLVASCVVLALGLAAAHPAEASVMFSATGSGLSAQATFTITETAGSTNTLTILLSNTDAQGDNFTSSQILTGLFFNLGTAAFVKPAELGATLPSGSSVDQFENCTVSCQGATNVGGEWGYAFAGSGFNPAVVGANQGVGSAGYLGGPSTLFGGTNYEGPPSGSLNGAEFGIVPDGWTGTGNGGVQNDALIEGPVKFVLIIPDGLTEAMISNVYFTYGTSFGEMTLTGTTGNVSIPEPGTLALMGIGLAYLAARGRRRHRQDV
jgi:hypothetical protein